MDRKMDDWIEEDEAEEQAPLRKRKPDRDLAEDLDLAFEPRSVRDGVERPIAHHLQRDRPARRDLDRPVDGALAPSVDNALEAVAGDRLRRRSGL